MKRLYVFCEGPTEQRFCNQVLTRHLFSQGRGCVHTVKIANRKHHQTVNRGGIGSYATLKRDILSVLSRNVGSDVFFTTLIDLYALPAEFPGKATHARDPKNPSPHALALEAAFGEDIGDTRFIPHLQLHEYETMLFADPKAFCIAFENCDGPIERLMTVAAMYPSIEHIDDGKATAPSKRIIDQFPAYQGRKSTAGPDIAEYIGLAAIRAKCPHVDQWLKRLEDLAWK